MIGMIGAVNQPPIGNLQDLDTTDKSSVVAALNEVAATHAVIADGSVTGDKLADPLAVVIDASEVDEAYPFSITDENGRLALGIKRNGVQFTHRFVGTGVRFYTTDTDADGNEQIYEILATGLAARTEDGNNFEVGVAADGNKVLFITDRNGSFERFEMSLTGDRQLPILADSILFDYVGVVGTGQSLSIGSAFADTPALSTTQNHSNLEVSTANVVQALIEPVQSAVDIRANVETHHSGMANTIHAKAVALAGVSDYVMIHSASGKGNSGMAVIKKGGTGTSYANSIAAVQAGFNYAVADGGKRYMVGAVTLVHGETDDSNAAYATQISQMQNDYDEDIKAITGQPWTVPLLLCQMNSVETALSTLLQLQAHIDDPYVYLVCPKYMLPYADTAHLTNHGYRRLGEYYGKVYSAVVLHGERWEPLRPLSVSRIDAVITVLFHVPVLPLVFDSVLSALCSNEGFSYHDSTSSATISSVAISGSTVVITLSNTPTGTGKTLKYARTEVTIGGFAGGAGSLRDSDASYSSAYGYDLCNFCVAFELQLT